MIWRTVRHGGLAALLALLLCIGPNDLHGQALHWGSGDTADGASARFWLGSEPGTMAGGTSWTHRDPYDPAELFAYRYGTNAVHPWSSNRFVPQGATVRWVWGVQQASMAPGRYRLDDLFVRCRFTSGSASKYTMSVTKRVGDFLVVYDDVTGGRMEWDVFSLVDGQGDVNVYLSNLAGYTPVEFDVAPGDDVHLWFGFHSTGTANQPQCNTVGGIDDLAGAPGCLYFQRTTGSSTAPIEDQNLTSGAGETSHFMRASVSSANRILYRSGTQTAEGNWLDNGEGSKVVTIPAGPANTTYYVLLHDVTPGAGNFLIVDLASTNSGDGTYTQGHRTMIALSGNVGTNDWVESGPTTGNLNKVDLRGKVEKDSTFDVGFKITGDSDSYECDVFWRNRTEGMGSKRVRTLSDGSPKTSTTASVSGTTVTASAAIFEAVDTSYRLEFTGTGNIYDIVGFTSSTVVTVSPAPTETAGGDAISVVNNTDRATFSHVTKFNGSRGNAGYAMAGGRPAYITITDPLNFGTIGTCTVAWQPVIQLGDSNTNNWQALGYQLPKSFTHERSYWWASIGGSTADLTIASQTTGDDRFCHTTPGMGDLCEMDECLFVWSSFGTNDIWQMLSYPTINRVTAGVIRSAARVMKEGYQWSPNADFMILTTTSFTDDSQTQQDAAVEVADGLAGLGKCGRVAYYDLQPLANSDPSYMHADGVHLTEDGAIAVSAAAAAAYETGRSNR